MDNGINNPNINVPSLIKTYVSEDGLRTYHEQVKAALRKRALKSDLKDWALRTELFSRDYNDLINKPIINEKNDSALYITDTKGNIIAQLDENGFNAFNIQEKGTNLVDKYATKEELAEAATNSHFIGTYDEYTAAYDNGLIAVGTIVLITDDDEETSGTTTAKLGTAILGTMILGQE